MDAKLPRHLWTPPTHKCICSCKTMCTDTTTLQKTYEANLPCIVARVKLEATKYPTTQSNVYCMIPLVWSQEKQTSKKIRLKESTAGILVSGWGKRKKPQHREERRPGETQVRKLQPRGQIQPVFVFINKVLLKHHHAFF